MSSSPSVWDRLRRARIVQVLAVYLGASWVVLQITDMLVDALTLPRWVVPVALILLLVGMLVILATAWVQSHPATEAGEKSGDLPKNWELAPRDALSSIKRGELPHLTWARAITGGIVAIALLFTGAGVRMAFEGGTPFGPAEATASLAAEGIAVVPFDVRGADLEIWREGMMDLLANGLDGIGGYRTIDSRTLMARWHEHVADSVTADLSTTLAIGRSVGARYVIEGSVVGLADNVRLAANVYDLDSGEEVASAQSEGPVADVMRLADELAVGIMRDLLAAVGQGGEADFTAETITTSSLPALRAFLEGENHYRNGNFADAVASFERAVAADTTFAIALVRLSEAYGWLESADSERMLEVGERAFAQAGRMSPRYQFIMEGWDALNHGSAAGVASLEHAVQKYPDDPEAWFLLAETYIHVGGGTYGSDDDIWNALQKSVALDPNFAPYLVHVSEYAVLRGDRPKAEQAIARYASLTGNREALAHVEMAILLLLGDESEQRAALAMAERIPAGSLDTYLGTFTGRHDHAARDAAVDAVWARRTDQNRTALQAFYASTMAQVARGMEISNDPAVSPSDRMIFTAASSFTWGIEPPATLDRSACEQPAFAASCLLFVGTAAAQQGQWSEAQAVIARLRAESASVAEANPERSARLASMSSVVEGAMAWRRGDRARGRALLEPLTGTAFTESDQARMELAWLEVAENRPQQALRQFRSLMNGWRRPIALYGMATTLEQLDQPQEALRYWASLARMTEDGDDLARVRETRAAVTRLSAESD